MKYKKYSYILVLVLMLIVGINSINALEKKFIVNDKIINASSNLIQFVESSECVNLFGEKNNPNSIRGLVNDVLKYPKIIVPILVIVLGMLDFGKAVIASKEDEMKKAQSTFIKRVVIGVAVFFVPTILDIIMYFTDTFLGMTTCGL